MQVLQSQLSGEQGVEQEVATDWNDAALNRDGIIRELINGGRVSLVLRRANDAERIQSFFKKVMPNVRWEAVRNAIAEDRVVELKIVSNPGKIGSPNVVCTYGVGNVSDQIDLGNELSTTDLSQWLSDAGDKKDNRAAT